MHANKSITYTDANALPTLLFQLLNGSYLLHIREKTFLSFTRVIWHSKQTLLDGYWVLISNGSMDRVQVLYGQCFRGWMCGSGSAGNRSRRTLWIISKLVKVITAAGVVRNRFVAHPR